MIIVTIVALFVSIKHWKEEKELHLITYYLAAAVAIDLLCIYFELFTSGNIVAKRIQVLLLVVFMIIEITIFFIYLSRNINSHELRTIIKFIYLTFFILNFYLSVIHPSLFYNMASQFAVVESFCLVVPCLFYFYELFACKRIALINQSSFWVVTGILFYNSCSIPIFLLEDYIRHKLAIYNDAVLALNYILYSILFLLFIRAYLCRKKLISS